ncbi:hypothetical protein D9M68_777130 [compost metagenome]
MGIIEPAHDNVRARSNIGCDGCFGANVFPAFLINADCNTSGIAEFLCVSKPALFVALHERCPAQEPKTCAFFGFILRFGSKSRRIAEARKTRSANKACCSCKKCSSSDSHYAPPPKMGLFVGHIRCPKPRMQKSGDVRLSQKRHTEGSSPFGARNKLRPTAAFHPVHRTSEHLLDQLRLKSSRQGERRHVRGKYRYFLFRRNSRRYVFHSPLVQ